jgi:hypothetical protein
MADGIAHVIEQHMPTKKDTQSSNPGTTKKKKKKKKKNQNKNRMSEREAEVYLTD